MKAGTTILAIGLLITFVQEFVAAENSTCDFNLPDRIKVYNDFVKKMAKHRRLQQKTVVYFAFISGQSLSSCSLLCSRKYIYLTHTIYPRVPKAHGYVAANMASARRRIVHDGLRVLR